MNAEHDHVRVDPDLLGIIPQFFQNIREDIEGLEKLAEDAFLGDSLIFGHSLKGTGAAFGFPRLTEIGRELEVVSREGDRSRALVLIGSVLSYVNSVTYTAR